MKHCKRILPLLVALALAAGPVIAFACVPGGPVGFVGGPVVLINPSDELPGGG